MADKANKGSRRTIVVMAVGLAAFVLAAVNVALGGFVAVSVTLAVIGVALAVAAMTGGKPAKEPDGEKGADMADLTGDDVIIFTPDDDEEGTGEGIDPTLELVHRATNAAATLRDLARRDLSKGGLTPVGHALSIMLRDSGVSSWTDAPEFRIAIFPPSGRYVANISATSLNDRAYDHLIALEGALNVLQDDLSGFASDATEAEVFARARASLLAVSDLEIPEVDPALCGESAGDGDPEARGFGEWGFRARFCDAVEHAKVSLRVNYRLRANVSQNVACVSFELVRPNVFGIAEPTEERRVLLARRYAFHLAAFLARVAFWASSEIHRVVLLGHERGSEETLLMLDLTRDSLGKFVEDIELNYDTPELESECPVMRASADESGWFAPIDAGFELNDELFHPAWRLREVELRGNERCSDRLFEVSGARTLADFGINEHALRVNLWESIKPYCGSNTARLVSELKKVRDSAEEFNVVEAANRTMELLVEGVIEPSDEEAVRSAFIFGSTLDRVIQSLSADGSPDQIIATLQGALAEVDELGTYYDDSDTVYRYFGSLAERIAFNRSRGDDTRKVSIIPEGYYHAHLNLANLLKNTDRFDELQPELELLERIAPYDMKVGLLRVRALEDSTRIFDAQDELRRLLPRAATVRDESLYAYRLAFISWRLGQTDLSSALYQHVITRGTDISVRAWEEFSGFVMSEQSLTPVDPSEVSRVLAREGIEVLDADALEADCIEMASLCCDQGAFTVAQALTGIAYEARRSTVLPNIFESLG